MNTDPEKFEIDVDGTTYRAQRSATDKNIYNLHSPNGSYLIARDCYGIWVELASRSGSARIPLTKIGQQIDDYSGKEISA
jgi:hypothetical protein